MTTLTSAPTAERFPQLSTCRWCKRVVSRDAASEPWSTAKIGVPGRDTECPVAPNPEDGPMPGHEPGTAVVSQPAEKPVEQVDPATLPKPVIPWIPQALPELDDGPDDSDEDYRPMLPGIAWDYDYDGYPA